MPLGGSGVPVMARGGTSSGKGSGKEGEWGEQAGNHRRRYTFNHSKALRGRQVVDTVPAWPILRASLMEKKWTFTGRFGRSEDNGTSQLLARMVKGLFWPAPNQHAAV